jgi:hypothetical protein
MPATLALLREGFFMTIVWGPKWYLQDKKIARVKNYKEVLIDLEG